MSDGTIILGGPEARIVRKVGDLVYSVEHVNGQESLCLWRANKAPGNGAMILGITVLGNYFDGSTGMPTKMGIERCKDALRILGFSGLDSFALRHVLDTIYLAIDEVIKLPPLPPKGVDLSGVEGVTLRANGDVVMKH
jgi:hypothetical protein